MRYKQYALIFVLFFSLVSLWAIESENWDKDGFQKDTGQKIKSAGKAVSENKYNPLQDDYFSTNDEADFFTKIPKDELKNFKNYNKTELIEKIENIKTEIYEIKTKLFQLSEATFKSSIKASSFSIRQKNNLSHLFRAEIVNYTVDNEKLFSAVYLDKEMPDEQVIAEKIFKPGLHELKLQINFSGKGDGIYSYLKDYVFVLKSKKKFNVLEGKVTKVKIILSDSNKLLKSLNNRPEVEFVFDYSDIDNSVLAKKVSGDQKE